jgi:sec-independent protein translocase protein TatB
MHFGDSIFIFLLALVLFGPKKLPEIGKQIGKLLAEFRRASNEFKFQIQEEIRNMEDDERRKKLAESQAQTKVAEQQVQALPTASAPVPAGPTILPPQTGVTVSASQPFATPGTETEAEAGSEGGVEPAAATETPVAVPEGTIAPEIGASAIGAPEPGPELGSGSEASVALKAHTNGAHAPAAEIPADEVAHHD